MISRILVLATTITLCQSKISFVTESCATKKTIVGSNYFKLCKEHVNEIEKAQDVSNNYQTKCLLGEDSTGLSFMAEKSTDNVDELDADLLLEEKANTVPNLPVEFKIITDRSFDYLPQKIDEAYLEQASIQRSFFAQNVAAVKYLRSKKVPLIRGIKEHWRVLNVFSSQIDFKSEFEFLSFTVMDAGNQKTASTTDKDTVVTLGENMEVFLAGVDARILTAKAKGVLTGDGQLEDVCKKNYDELKKKFEDANLFELIKIEFKEDAQCSTDKAKQLKMLHKAYSEALNSKLALFISEFMYNSLATINRMAKLKMVHGGVRTRDFHVVPCDSTVNGFCTLLSNFGLSHYISDNNVDTTAPYEKGNRPPEMRFFTTSYTSSSDNIGREEYKLQQQIYGEYPYTGEEDVFPLGLTFLYLLIKYKIALKDYKVLDNLQTLVYGMVSPLTKVEIDKMLEFDTLPYKFNLLEDRISINIHKKIDEFKITGETDLLNENSKILELKLALLDEETRETVKLPCKNVMYDKNLCMIRYLSMLCKQGKYGLSLGDDEKVSVDQYLKVNDPITVFKRSRITLEVAFQNIEDLLKKIPAIVEAMKKEEAGEKKLYPKEQIYSAAENNEDKYFVVGNLDIVLFKQFDEVFKSFCNKDDLKKLQDISEPTYTNKPINRDQLCKVLLTKGKKAYKTFDTEEKDEYEKQVKKDDNIWLDTLII